MQGMKPLLGARGPYWAALVQGPLMALLAVALWWLAAPLVLSGAELLGPAMVFQILSVVAVPHLVCSHHLARYLAQERVIRG
jgi:hypothetical protein